jgi:hypothetical protein
LVLPHELPDGLSRVQFGGVWLQVHQADVAWNAQLAAGLMPPATLSRWWLCVVVANPAAKRSSDSKKSNLDLWTRAGNACLFQGEDVGSNPLVKGCIHRREARWVVG